MSTVPILQDLATPSHFAEDTQQSLSSTETKQSAMEMDYEEMGTNPSKLAPTQSTVKHFELRMKPRDYQMELAEPGIEGKNYIVVAPTNSGKTLVAAVIIANHFEKNSGQKRLPKVVMVMKTRSLANRKAKQMNEYIPNALIKCRTGNCGNNRDHVQ